MREQSLVDSGNVMNNLVRMNKMLDTLEPKDITDNLSLIFSLRNKVEDLLSGFK